jgi:hypothetical protein
MNAMIASGGHPWAVVRLEDPKQYLAALESASIDQQIAPLAEFLAQRIQRVGRAGASISGLER